MTNDERATVRALAKRVRSFRFRGADQYVTFMSELASDLAKLATDGAAETEVKAPTGEFIPGVRIIGSKQIIVCTTGRRPPKPANDDIHAAARRAFKVV